jgi:hypothetical protein
LTATLEILCSIACAINEFIFYYFFLGWIHKRNKKGWSFLKRFNFNFFSAINLFHSMLTITKIQKSVFH